MNYFDFSLLLCDFLMKNKCKRQNKKVMHSRECLCNLDATSGGAICFAPRGVKFATQTLPHALPAWCNLFVGRWLAAAVNITRRNKKAPSGRELSPKVTEGESANKKIICFLRLLTIGSPTGRAGGADAWEGIRYKVRSRSNIKPLARFFFW